ncbi:GYF domain-containing protein [Gimesia sp.]|uniref:DUF4339 domain-containing protein n=1 Tax=Gimesia sp. TaxID=2024833 RepID=UPI000C4B4A24|nr:GYF domain-containing protein [Gimesia sp.]MAX38235.1 hypothetical protein [Gimesia sp.]HBL43678.1 hypothetical protein [Planctomycetaceae bacterium]|tara:strand:- start:750 stop:1883 length:1134 start_codon:yes stop_codon:yes gene_type:complete
MATEWYCKQSDQATGPFTFREMMEMVREEQLLPETMVRPHYLDEWQRADSVVGLFHMARRDPATLPVVNNAINKPEDELAGADDLDAFLEGSDEPAGTGTDAVHQELERPGWLKRLLSLRSSKIPPVPVDPHREVSVDLSRPAPNGSAIPGEEIKSEAEALPEPNAPVESAEDAVSTGAYSEETWASTVNAAVERIDARAPKQEEVPPPRQMVPAIKLSILEHPVFRKLILVCVLILCASVGIYGFVNWLGQGKLYFPLIGETSPLLFLVYSACSFLVSIALVSLLVYVASPYLRLGYKLGATIATASITVFCLLNWSEQQNMIFPSRKPIEAKLIFPFMGECSQFSYWMYFVDVVIFVAVLTYFAAWWLETHADEV